MTVRKIQKLRKSILRRNRKVRKANAEFSKMTMREKRVTIAKDVLKFLDEKKIIAFSGCWLEAQFPASVGEITGLNTGEINKMELQQLLPMAESCNTCALGSMLYATIMRRDSYTVNEMSSLGTIMSDYRIGVANFEHFGQYMVSLFSANQMRLIENAFENGDGGIPMSDNTYSKKKAVRFFMEYDATEGEWTGDLTDDDTRLRIIMNNIIRHNGTFDPRDNQR